MVARRRHGLRRCATWKRFSTIWPSAVAGAARMASLCPALFGILTVVLRLAANQIASGLAHDDPRPRPLRLGRRGLLCRHEARNQARTHLDDSRSSPTFPLHRHGCSSGRTRSCMRRLAPCGLPESHGSCGGRRAGLALRAIGDDHTSTHMRSASRSSARSGSSRCCSEAPAPVSPEPISPSPTRRSMGSRP